MKNTMLLILFFSIQTSFAQDIAIDSFYTPGSTWTEAVFRDNDLSYHSAEWGASAVGFRIERDTSILGTNYHLLSINLDRGSYSYSFPTSNLSITSFNYSVGSNNYNIFGRIRTDSNRVYFTLDSPYVIHDYYSAFTPGTEYLLYDFNLDINTTVIDSLGIGITVTNIDSVLLSSGKYIKKYSDTASPNTYWLQGIGSSSGMLFGFNLIDPGPDRLYVTKTTTLCYDNPAFSYHFSFPDSILLGNLQNNCFDVASLDITNINQQNTNDLVQYPNPAKEDYLYFTSQNLSQVKQVSVYDGIGNLLLIFLHPFSVGEERIFAPLIPGFYIIKIEFNDHSTIEKKLVRL